MSAQEIFPPSLEPQGPTMATVPLAVTPQYIERGGALERLLAAFRRARDARQLTFALLIGEPGMGKTRTAHELERRAVREAPRTRFFAGAGDGGGVAFSAFARLLGARFGILPSDPAEDAREKIIAGVAEVLPADRVTEVAHLTAHLMRVPFADSPVVSPLAESPQQLEARMFIALRRFLAAEAADGPLILCFENIELCGPETINLLHYLAVGLASSPVVILGTARASLFDRYPSFGDSDVPLDRIDLGPLTEKEAERLVRELCREVDAVPHRLIAHAKSLGGSPRAVYELLRLLVESDILVRGKGGAGWRIDTAALAKAELPRDHDGLVARRLEVMPEAERDLLEKAASVGETFWVDALVALVRMSALATDSPDGPSLNDIATAGDRAGAEVSDALVSLADREWIVEEDRSSLRGEREYRFAYPNLWSSVYERVDEERRRTYHRTVAQWLELRPDGRDVELQEDIARHLERAGDAIGAASRYRRAANAARQMFFNDKAIRLYASALSSLGEADLAARIYLWHDLGSVYELKGDFDAALGAFERMLRLAWVYASRSKAAVAYNKMGRVWRRKGNLTVALNYLERGRDLFEQAGDGRGIAGSLDDVGQVLYLLGRFDDAFDKVTQGLAQRGKDGDQRSIAQSLSTLGNIQKDRGRFAEAYNCHTEALELRRKTGDRAGVIASLNNLAVLAFEHDNATEARRGWEQALSEAEEIGALPLQALALANLGELALTEDHIEEARSRLDDALDIAEEIQDRRLEVEALRNSALLEIRAGNTEAARELAHDAHEVAASAGLRDSEARALVTLGEVFGGALFDAEATIVDPMPGGDGELGGADGYFARGLEILREIGNQSELARALERYGRYRIENDAPSEGRALLEEALAIFSRLGMRRADDVRALLASL